MSTIALTPSVFQVKDPGSAATHFIGFLLAILATPCMLVHAALNGSDLLSLIALSVFMISMILLYGASTAYHTFCLPETRDLVLKRLDHMMIFVLIAGSYTPVCLIALRGAAGTRLLILVWAIAFLGMIFKMCWVTCPRWVSSVLYIAMGWLCVSAGPSLVNAMTVPGFLWLLAGGLIYTIGGVIYALKLKAFNLRNPNFGSHEIFHLFVMGGSLCHFLAYYLYLA